MAKSLLKVIFLASVCLVTTAEFVPSVGVGEAAAVDVTVYSLRCTDQRLRSGPMNELVSP